MAITAATESAHVAPVLWGRSLRFVLVDELMARSRSVVTVAELVQVVAAQGFEVSGRASKVISDSLRWEVRRGRVERVGRGCYRYVRAPRTTAKRIRTFAARCRDWIVAVMRGEEPPPTPPDPRAPPWLPPWPPHDPPWQHMGWLWAT